MKHLYVASAAIFALGLSACNSGGPTNITTAPVLPQIQVSATGISAQVPDVAIVMAGAVSEGKTAREAMIANATKMTDVFDALTEAGIEEKNITTSQLSLQPRYNYQNRQNGRKAPRIDGYEARNTVTVKSYDVEDVGVMLDALVKAGVNNINNVQFSVKDPKAAKAQAREEAITEAREKAQAMAKAAGVKLGNLTSINESGGGFTPQFQGVRARASLESASTPIAAGEQTLSVTVNMVYEIKN